MSFEKTPLGVVHVCVGETDPITGEMKRRWYIEPAWDGRLSKDQKERFTSWIAAADASMLRGIASGAPEAETELMRGLLSYLQDKADGKDNHPAEPTKRAVGKAEVAARAYAALASLVDLKGKIDGCKRLKACSTAAWHVDEVLEDRGVSLANWLPGAGKPHQDENEHIHPYATRIKRWFDDGVFPEQDLPAFEEEREVHGRAIEACGENERLAA